MTDRQAYALAYHNAERHFTACVQCRDAGNLEAHYCAKGRRCDYWVMVLEARIKTLP
jgi:hypothetical protein